ncbi:MAG: FAD-binding oxidoreductase [Candidatus Omnitrophota bacterium]
MIIKTDQAAIQSYFEDSSNIEGGHAEKVFFPETAGDISSILKEASENGTPVTVSGGGTGTTGGRVPFGGVTVSMEKFNKIKQIVPRGSSGGISVVQAGALVDDLKRSAYESGLFYACYPTEHTAFVGGTIATNASGARSFKYGSTRNSVRKLTAVLSGGQVIEIERGRSVVTRNNNRIEFAGAVAIDIPIPTYTMPETKNSAGYYAKEGMDPIDLFIGQEGTLAVIVEAEIELAKRPEGVFSCCAFFRDEFDAWSFCAEARSGPGGGESGTKPRPGLLAIEYMDRNSLAVMKDKYPNIPEGAAACVFFEQEVSVSDEEGVLDGWQRLLDSYNVASDATWAAMTEKERGELVEFRHALPSMINEIVRRSGFKKLSTDFAVPDDKLFEMMRFYRDIYRKSAIDHVVFGHIGESHVHTNLLPKTNAEYDKAWRLCLECARKAVDLGGTVSAEHGIGKTKHAYLNVMYGENGVLEMAKLKKAVDPACILGLDNIFPKELLSAI